MCLPDVQFCGLEKVVGQCAWVLLCCPNYSPQWFVGANLEIVLPYSMVVGLWLVTVTPHKPQITNTWIHTNTYMLFLALMHLTIN